MTTYTDDDLPKFNEEVINKLIEYNLNKNEIELIRKKIQKYKIIYFDKINDIILYISINGDCYGNKLTTSDVNFDVLMKPLIKETIFVFGFIKKDIFNFIKENINLIMITYNIEGIFKNIEIIYDEYKKREEIKRLEEERRLEEKKRLEEEEKKRQYDIDIVNKLLKQKIEEEKLKEENRKKVFENERLIDIRQVNNHYSDNKHTQISNNSQTSYVDESRKIQEEMLRINKQQEERSRQEDERRIQQEERRRQDDALRNRGWGTMNRTPKQDFDDKFYGTGRWAKK